MVAVVIYHAFPAWLPGGFVGVDVFFVISGYLITGILQRSLEAHRFSFAGFYARRIRRILPALIVTLLASLVAGWFLLLPLRFDSLGKHVVAAAGFASNVIAWSEAGYFDAEAVAKPLLHLWSLGVEEQFYLLWPLLLWLFAKLRVRAIWPLVTLAALSFMVNLALTASAPDAAFYLPVTRMWELAIGGVLACVAIQPRRFSAVFALVGLALIAAALVLVDGHDPYPGWRALLPTVGTCLVIVAAPSGRLDRLIGNPGFVAIGLISYPLYLWHWVLLSFGYLVLGGAPSTTMQLVLVAISVALAALTYLGERPIRSRRASARQATALVTALVLIASIATLVYRDDGVVSRFPAVAAELLEYRYDYLVDAHAGECWLAARDPADGFLPTCLPPESAPASVFIWGDSHAARLRPGIDRVYGTSRAVFSATRDVCPPSLLTSGNCEAGNRFILSVLERTRPAVVVLFANWSAYSSEIVEDTVELSLRLIRSGVRRVIIVGPAPAWPQNLSAVIYDAWQRGSFDAPPPHRVVPDREGATVAVDRRMKAMQLAAGVEYVSLIDLLCDREGCLTYVPGSTTDLMSYDYGHLTTPGAVVVARGLNL